MILADTSVWVDHLRVGNRRLADLLSSGEVSFHPMVVGELACGNLRRRKEVIALLHALPALDRVTDDEILFFVEKHRLHGKGLGLIDMHLLASCQLAGARLWTLDKRLKQASSRMEIGFE